MGTFLKNLLTLPSSFFVLNFQFFFYVFFFCRTPCFFSSVVTFDCLLKSGVVSVLWSLFFCRKFCFLPSSFFSFLNKLLLMFNFFCRKWCNVRFCFKRSTRTQSFEFLLMSFFFAKPSMFPFFFQSLIFFGVCFFEV